MCSDFKTPAVGLQHLIRSKNYRKVNYRV